MTSSSFQQKFALILDSTKNIRRRNKTRHFTFCAGLGARRVGPGDAEAILDGGGRARGRDILYLLLCVYD